MQQAFSKDNFKSKLSSTKLADHNDSIFESKSPLDKINFDSVSATKIVSQSTLADNSTKIPVKTTNQSMQVVQGSKTTDDLLQLSLETSAIKNAEYPNIKNRGSLIVNRNNSTLADKRSMMNLQDQGGVSIANGRRNNMKSVLGDYSSQTHLPKVKESLNFGNGQFKKNDPFQNQRSKVELSRKELQNFQVTGVVSKDFIHQNKKELENFIKSQTRLKLENQGLENSQSQIFGIEYSQRVDGSHLVKESAQSEEQKLLAGLDPSTFVFSDDVRPERGFSGETSQINSKVVENWINQTLSDAEHLDIPSVILKPENKIPITRYGIDRFSLTQGGLSNDSVDRIYRGLFVYSVGFYENLKKQMANCGSDQQLILMTSLWKTFNVLLEYCCKTDYRLLISKITQKYDQEKQDIIDKYKNLMQIEFNEKKLLKQNMLVMQTYQEQLEKDRNNERSLRLKLEEEYMQIQRNHEEEVTLRLKFEGKLNQLNTAHRELEIKYDRVQQQLEQSLMHQNRLDQLCKVQSDELIQLRTRETDQLSQLDILREFKSSALIEIEKKNKVIAVSEESRKKAIDEADIIRYQVQDQDNQTRRLEIRIQDLTVGRISLENQIHTLESQIKDYEEKAEAQKKLFATEREKYEQLAIVSTQNLEQLEALRVTSTDHEQLIDQLRQQLNNEALKFEDHEMHALVYKVERDELKRELNLTKGDYTTTSSNLQLINADRHRFEDLYNIALNKIEMLENVISDNNRKIEQNLQLIAKQDQQIKELRENKELLEKKIDTISRERDAQVNKLNLQIKKCEELIASTAEARDALNQTVKEQQEEMGKKVTEIFEKEQYIQKLLKQIEKTKENIKLMKEQASDLQKQQLVEQDKAEQERDNAQQALFKQQQLEETVRFLSHQQQSIQQNYSKQFKQIQETFAVKYENLLMESEDAKGYLRPYYDKFLQAKSALDSVEEAERIKANFEEFKREFEQLTQELKLANEKIEIQEELFEEQDKDFDEIIQRVIEMEHKRISEQEEKYVQKIKVLNEQLIKATINEKSQSKKNLKLEKQIEIMSKSNSQAQMKSSGERKLVGRSKESQESSNSKDKNASQSSLKKKTTPEKSQDKKKNGRGNFDSMIEDAKKKKKQQDNVNTYIMGRQKTTNQNQTHTTTTDTKKLNRTVIPKKKFNPINVDNLNNESGTTTNREDQDQVDQQDTSQKDQLENSDFEEGDESIEEGDHELEDFEQEGEDEAPNEPEVPVVRDLQAEKFAEYLSYVLEKGQRFLDSIKLHFEKIKSGELLADSQAAKDDLKRIMKENEEKIPEQFANLHLTDEQKERLEQEQEMQKMNFQVDNSDILPPEDSESDVESGKNREKQQNVSEIRKNMFARKSKIESNDTTERSPAKKKQPKNNLTQIFSTFADNHNKFLDKFVKEHEERVAKAALERRKVKEVSLKVDNQIRGRQKSHYLIKMKLDPDYYELHRGLLVEAIKKAELDKANRQASLDAAQKEEQRKSSEVARLLLERHQAKVSKIVIEREYLNKKQTDQLPQIPQVKVDQLEKSPKNEKLISIQPSEKQVEQQSAKRLLVQHQDQNLNDSDQQQIQKPNQSSVQQILDVVNNMTNMTPVVDSEIKQYIKGGVAGINRSYNVSSNKKVSGGPSAIRTLIRAVNSRAIN